ncbi:STAS domain-containing protein [Geodermatophilus sp. SYSU D00703]
MPHLRVALVPAPDQVVVRLTGDAETATVDRLTTALQEAAALGTRRVVVDVAGARFADSSALQALTVFTAVLGSTGRQCRVVGAPAATRRQVRVAGLADRLELDGPLAGEDPVRPSATATPVAGPVPAAAGPAGRAVAVRPARAGRRAEERPYRRRLRLGTLRRWR